MGNLKINLVHQFDCTMYDFDFGQDSIREMNQMDIFYVYSRHLMEIKHKNELRS